MTALTIMQTLGLMAAAHLMVPLGLLTRLQRWFAGLRLDPKRHERRLVTIPPLNGGQPPLLGVPKASAEGNSAGAGDLLRHRVQDASVTGWGDLPRES